MRCRQANRREHSSVSDQGPEKIWKLSRENSDCIRIFQLLKFKEMNNRILSCIKYFLLPSQVQGPHNTKSATEFPNELDFFWFNIQGIHQTFLYFPAVDQYCYYEPADIVPAENIPAANISLVNNPAVNIPAVDIPTDSVCKYFQTWISFSAPPRHAWIQKGWNAELRNVFRSDLVTGQLFSLCQIQVQ